MTYDALLALRGWGEPEFRLVQPDFLEAVRFALFTERLAPEWIEAQTVMSRSVSGLTGPAFGEAMKIKTIAEKRAKTLASVLMPDG